MSCLADATWPEIPPGVVAVVPVGSLEQHGPHLPLDTDTVIADAVARRAVELSGDERIRVLPSLAFGSSGEHQAFRGTVSIGTDVLYLVAIELVRSIRTWADRVVFVNGHGGNVSALDGAVRKLRKEGHDVAWVACATEYLDLHAGFTETSLLLHLCPARVRVDRAEPGNNQPLTEILPAMLEGGVIAVSPNGVLGDPRGASAVDGARLLEQMAKSVASQVLP